MSYPKANTSLSLSARLLFYLGPPAIIAVVSIASPRTALLAPLSFLPTVFFYRKWRDTARCRIFQRAELEPLIWTFATVGTLGLSIALLIQTAIGSIAVTLLFGSGTTRDSFWAEFSRSTISDLVPEQLTHRAELAASWQNHVCNAVLAYVITGLVEETLKYLPIAYARYRGSPAAEYIDYAVAGALSFGVVETIGFLYAACEGSHESWPKLALTVFERVIGGALAHLLTAALTALRAMRYEAWWRIIGPSVLLHGTWNFAAMTASAIEGNVGWVHPTGVGNTAGMLGAVVGLVVTAGWLVKEEWLALKKSWKEQ
ncbi:MAG: hypothetical protein LQ338_003136 [Usnochroma carphineum]|nr:MAG: hypothetical protein LQ338_003136 [Usnochroma carphineum]